MVAAQSESFCDLLGEKVPRADEGHSVNKLENEKKLLMVQVLELCRFPNQSSYLFIQMVAYFGEVFLTSSFCKPQNLNTATVQKVSSVLVSFNRRVLKMLTPVEFDNQMCFMTIKIDNIFTDDLLTMKLHGVKFEVTDTKVCFLLKSHYGVRTWPCFKSFFSMT